MIVGSVRSEEAKVFDGDAGYHNFHSEDGALYGSFEVFWVEENNVDFDHEPVQPGWYWAAGYPGCLWDGDPVGPFASSSEAVYDADEYHPDND